MAKRWKKEDETYLKRYAKAKTLDQLGERFKTDRDTILAKLGDLGLAAKDSVEKIKVENDPLVKVLEKGVRALHRKQWKQALDSFNQVIDEADFDVARWYRILEEEKVQVWYTAPTAIRMLMKAGLEPLQARDLSALRFMASVGEPLNPEAVVWGREAFGIPFHDNWWQTETGGIMISNYLATTIHPGSMGRPMPGIEATILRRDDHGAVLVEGGKAVEAECGEEGELALRPGWPSMV